MCWTWAFELRSTFDIYPLSNGQLFELFNSACIYNVSGFQLSKLEHILFYEALTSATKSVFVTSLPIILDWYIRCMG